MYYDFLHNKILLICLLFILIGGLIFGDVVFRKRYSTDEILGVDIELKAENLEISLWNKEFIQVTVYNSVKEGPSFEVRRKKLIGKSSATSVFAFTDCIVEFLIPEDFYAIEDYDGYEINTVSGSIDLSQLWGDLINVKSVNGDILLKKCESNNLKANTKSGNIIVEELYSKGNAELETISGNISLSGEINSIEAKSISGGINITVDRPLKADTTLKSTSGNIRVEMPENSGFTFEFDTISGMVGNEFTGYSGGKHGDNEYKNSNFILSTKTVSGDIKVIKK